MASHLTLEERDRVAILRHRRANQKEISRAVGRARSTSPNRGHGHHWFGNAESYFLVGDALGKAMLELLSE